MIINIGKVIIDHKVVYLIIMITNRLCTRSPGCVPDVNDHQVVYLTARSMALHEYTRHYIFNQLQEVRIIVIIIKTTVIMSPGTFIW